MKQIVDQSKIEIAISILQYLIECNIGNQIYLRLWSNLVNLKEVATSGALKLKPVINM